MGWEAHANIFNDLEDENALILAIVSLRQVKAFLLFSSKNI